MLNALIIVGLIAGGLGLAMMAVSWMTKAFQSRNDRSSGVAGLAGMMSEIDRITRPSSEDVVKSREKLELHEDDIGGD